MAIADMTGQRFGRLAVVERAPNAGTRASWRCKCDCGNEKVVRSQYLKRGETKSCGCLNSELASQRMQQNNISNPSHPTHGRSFTPEYNSWKAMRQRCYNPNSVKYHDYGGRGITVCDRWRDSFENFFEDMGERPTLAHTLDRFPNNDGNYELSNCRWATPVEQGNNKRTRKGKMS